MTDLTSLNMKEFYSILREDLENIGDNMYSTVDDLQELGDEYNVDLIGELEKYPYEVTEDINGTILYDKNEKCAVVFSYIEERVRQIIELNIYDRSKISKSKELITLSQALAYDQEHDPFGRYNNESN